MKRCVLAFLAITIALILTGCDPKAIRIWTWMWSENHKSLDFYGKIVDQDGHAVEGVKVTAAVGTYVSLTESGGRKYYTVSDAAGQFSFTGIHGAGCGYLLEKPGFEFSQRQPFASRPKDYIPDPSKPSLFSIWRLHGEGHMLGTQIQAGIACDGTPRRFDPLTGRRDAGNLVVTLIRKPVNIDPGKPFDWILTLGVSGGGLIEASGAYPFEAPVSGYQNSIAIPMPAEMANWTPNVNRSYYFFDGNHYGRFTIDVMANYQPPPTHIEVASYVNPTGSRNLEPMVDGRNTPSIPRPTDPSKPPSVIEDKASMILSALDAENNRGINVYGKVIDQFGTPVTGVAVHGGVLLNAGFDASRSVVFDTQTDREGLFSFEGLHGIRLGVKMEKPGYEFNPNLYVNWWNSYKPDRNSPAVFTVYKLRGEEAMDHKEFDSRVPYDGQTAAFDLLAGRKDSNGDLRITLTRNPLKVRRGVDRFDWSVTIEIVGGGLTETSDLYPYEAPESGYLPTFSLNIDKNSPSWTQRLTKTFYVRTKNNQFGRIDIDLTTDSERPQGTGISIKSFMNPPGSRNLEPDLKR